MEIPICSCALCAASWSVLASILFKIAVNEHVFNRTVFSTCFHDVLWQLTPVLLVAAVGVAVPTAQWLQVNRFCIADVF